MARLLGLDITISPANKLRGAESFNSTGRPGATNLNSGMNRANINSPNSIVNTVPYIGGVKINQSYDYPQSSMLCETPVASHRSQSSTSYRYSKATSQQWRWKIRTTLNFLSLLTEGNESQNIRLFDGDVTVARSPVELREQIIKAGQTSLNPDTNSVTGRVRDPGFKFLPQGHTQSGTCRSGRAEITTRSGGIHSLQPQRQHRQAQILFRW